MDRTWICLSETITLALRVCITDCSTKLPIGQRSNKRHDQEMRKLINPSGRISCGFPAFNFLRFSSFGKTICPENITSKCCLHIQHTFEKKTHMQGLKHTDYSFADLLHPLTIDASAQDVDGVSCGFGLFLAREQKKGQPNQKQYCSAR